MPKHCSLLYTHINNDVDYIYPCCALEKSLVPHEEMIPATPENFSKALTMPLFERIRKHTEEQDELPEECRKCKSEEKAGKPSLRTYANDVLKLDKYIGTKPTIRYLDIKFGTHCNLACRMCGEDRSSKWQMINNPGVQPDLFFDVFDFDYFKHTDLSKVEYIKFLGGEPMLAKHHEQFLQLLINQVDNPENITLRYFTNGTIFPPKRVLEFWKEMKNVDIFFSVDSVYERNDWLRPGSSWDHLEKTIARFKEAAKDNNKIRLGNSSTITNLSIFNLADTMEWVVRNFELNEETTMFNTLVIPKHLCLTNLVDEDKQRVLASIKEQESRMLSAIPTKYHHHVNGLIKYIKSFMMRKSKETFTYEDISKLETKFDNYFNQDMKSVFPELFKRQK